MDFEVIFANMLNAIVVSAVTALIGFAVAFIQSKIKNDTLSHYLYEAADIIKTAVISVNQTYVETLKKEGKFDEIAQKEAFEKAKTAVMNMLSDKAKQLLPQIIGDIETWVNTQIEASVNLMK